MLELVLSGLFVGLMGSLHCVGMCGPLAIAVGSAVEKSGQRAARLLVFTLGKAVTYLLMGVAAGIIGMAANHTALGKGGFPVLSIVAGVAMIFFGGQTLVTRLRTVKDGDTGAVSTLLVRVLRSRNPATPFVGGMLTGLLPCGLLYGMVAKSVTAGSWILGGLTMLAFGMGTIPSLVATGTLSGLLSARTRRIGEIVAALSIIGMGGMSIMRGVKFLMAAGCCH